MCKESETKEYLFYNNTMKKWMLCLFILVMSVHFVACSTSTESFNYESANMQFMKGNYKQAQKYIDKALKSNSKKAEYLILAGHIYIELDKCDKAIEYFDSAIVSDDDRINLENNKESHRGKGLAYLKIGDCKKAIIEFDEALNIDVNVPLDRDILKYKIDALYSDKCYDDAIKLADIYRKNFGNDNDIYILEGKCYACLKKENKMKSTFDKVIKNGKVEGYYFLAEGYIQLDKYKEAVDNYELYLNNASQIDENTIRLKIINSLMKIKEYDKALSMAKSNVNSNDVELSKIYRKNVVAILEAKNSYDEAYVEAKEYLADYPEDKEMEKEVLFLETRIIK